MKELIKKALLYGLLGVFALMFVIFIGTFQYQRGIERGRVIQRELDRSELERTGKLE